jgi:hypothetical protein
MRLPYATPNAAPALSGGPKRRPGSNCARHWAKARSVPAPPSNTMTAALRQTHDRTVN